MERDNNKARTEAKKEYNEIVRVRFPDISNHSRLMSIIASLTTLSCYQELVQFIRKRDPRYKAHLASQQASNSGTSTPKRAPRPNTNLSTGPTAVFVEQEWQRAHVDAADLEWARAEGAGDEEWECVACGKSFRSEAAWDSHERSKKHLKAVEALKKEMEMEQDELGLEGVDVEMEEGDEDEDDSGGSGYEDAPDVGGDNEIAESQPSPPRSPTPEDVGVRISSTHDVASDDSSSNTQAKSKKSKPRDQAPERPVTPPFVPSKSKSKRRRRGPSPEPFDEDVAQSSLNNARKVGGKSRGKMHDDPSQGVGSGTTEQVDPSAPSKTLPSPEDEEPGQDDAPSETEAGAPHNGVGVEMSKKEKRRAREAKKKAREVGEGNSTALVSVIFFSRSRYGDDFLVASSYMLIRLRTVHLRAVS